MVLLKKLDVYVGNDWGTWRCEIRENSLPELNLRCILIMGMCVNVVCHGISILNTMVHGLVAGHHRPKVDD